MGNGSGIALGTRASVTNCEVQGSSSSNGIIVGIASLVSKCMVVLNSGQGVSAGDDSTISDTVTRSNGGAEIVGGNRVVLENCVADGNGSADDGIRVGTDSTIRGCTASNNGGVEILAGAGSTLETCTADGAGTDGDGIQVGDRATVRNCLAQNNHGAGIHVTGQRSRIESNQALYNYRGIEVDLGANVIVLNSAAGNVQPDLQLINYKVAAGNEYSPATSVSAATNPWSNIGY
jgi:hypothetical protein